MLEKIHKLLK